MKIDLKMGILCGLSPNKFKQKPFHEKRKNSKTSIFIPHKAATPLFLLYDVKSKTTIKYWGVLGPVLSLE